MVHYQRHRCQHAGLLQPQIWPRHARGQLLYEAVLYGSIRNQFETGSASSNVDYLSESESSDTEKVMGLVNEP